MARETIPPFLQEHLAVLVAKQITTGGAAEERFLPVLLDPTGAALSVIVANSPLPVTITPNPTAFVNSQITVTNASQIFSATNVTRNYLLIQNNDAVGNIYVRFAAAATVLTGVKIPPGANYELNSNVSSSSVNIIGDIASNANVVLVTG